MRFPYGSLHIKDLPFLYSGSKEVSGPQREKENTVKTWKYLYFLYSSPLRHFSLAIQINTTSNHCFGSVSRLDTNTKKNVRNVKVDWRAKRSLYRAEGFSYSFKIIQALKEKHCSFFNKKCKFFSTKFSVSPIFGQQKPHSNRYPDLETGSLKNPWSGSELQDVSRLTNKDAFLARVAVLLFVKDLDVLLDHGILVGLELAPGAHALQHNKAIPITITYGRGVPRILPGGMHIFSWPTPSLPPLPSRICIWIRIRIKILSWIRIR